MRLEWLEDILAVAETGSLSEAAQQRHLSQSAFSRRIQSIEEQLGVALFDRSHKPVTLRPTTADQREQISHLAHELRRLVNELQLGERRSSNRLVLASQHALTTSFTPPLVRRMQGLAPDGYIRLRSVNFDDCFHLLLSRRADIAMVYRSPLAPEPVDMTGLEVLELGSDRLIPVIGGAHLGDLNRHFVRGDLPIILYPNDVFLGRVLDRAILPELGRVSRYLPLAETALTLAAQELALEGVGVAWVPGSLTQHRIARGELIDLSHILPSCALEVTAIRATPHGNRAFDAAWSVLEEIATTGRLRGDGDNPEQGANEPAAPFAPHG